MSVSAVLKYAPAAFALLLSEPLTVYWYRATPAARVDTPKMPISSARRSNSPLKFWMNSWDSAASMSAAVMMLVGAAIVCSPYL